MNARIFCVAVGLLTASTWAQVPLFKMWVTEVYEVNPDGTYTAKCGAVNCPTQDLLPGIADPGDLINIEVTVEGWDFSTDAGKCSPMGEVCSISAQDCALSHCTGSVTSGSRPPKRLSRKIATRLRNRRRRERARARSSNS